MRGVQRPRVCTRPPSTSEEAGQDAIDFAASVGLHLDPWQQQVVRVTLAETDDGQLAAREVGYLVSRQNGKGAALEAIVLYGMYVVGDPLTVWTAHETKTSFEAFTRMKALIQDSPDLMSKTKSISASHGDEGVVLHNGCRLRFLARSKSSGRGFSPQRVVFDEAQELSKMAIAALMPSMGAQGNWQAVYTGTVPGPLVNHPDHWTRLRNRGRAGDSVSLAWMEWTPINSDDPERALLINRTDRKVWAQANPGLGYRKLAETIATFADALDSDDFDREELSIWPTVPDLGDKGTIDLKQWRDRKDTGAAFDEPHQVALTVDVSPDGQWSTIGTAGHAGDRSLVLVKSGRGTAWVADALVELRDKYDPVDIALDPSGKAGALLPDLEAAGLEVHAMTSREMQAACVGLQNAIRDGRLIHVDQPELNVAVKVGRVRMVGDAEVWDRKAGADISPLNAVTIAVHRLAICGGTNYDIASSVL